MNGNTPSRIQKEGEIGKRDKETFAQLKKTINALLF
jgi:hypothetical protein